VLHGDEFDCVVMNAPWPADRGSWAYAMLLRVNRWLNLARRRPGAQLERTLAEPDPDAIHIATEGPLGLAARLYCLRRGRWTWCARASTAASTRT
jgi:hypothetical protein